MPEPRFPTLYDYLVAARKVADKSDVLAVQKLWDGIEAPPPKPSPAPATPRPQLREVARQGGLGL